MNLPEIGQHIHKMEQGTKKDTDKHYAFINLIALGNTARNKSRGILANTSLNLKGNEKEVIL